MAKKKYYQRPDGLFETSRTINGRRVVFRGRSCREVDQKLLAYQEERKNGRKLPVIADEWEREHAKDVREKTMITYKPAIARICTHFPGAVGKITPLDVKRYVVGLGRRGYAKSTVGIDLTVLHQILDHAVLSGDIDINPALAVKLPKDLPETKRPALTPEQELAVETCRRGDWWYMGLILLYTGIRRGELLALEWQDIDRRAGVIHITKKVNYVGSSRPVLEPWLKSKNGKRDVPLLQPLADALPRNRVGKICPGKDGGYMQEQEFYRAWREFCRDAGMTKTVVDDNGQTREVPAVTPHQARHSFATICYEANLDTLATASILGDSEAVTRGVYIELRDAHKKESAERVEAYLTSRPKRSAEG